ncbi:F-box/LRR-repeat protein At2g43260-like [Panicum virgatum]|uniref:F-box/LRR-repeat protein At2g43260-like n=1 Tax=Panicum virgatum TaxID=38727 RepID=UPI0019D59900|nr:F-box/LRR-repeat protein At2g43260-like [Panicum virgatum]
MQSSERSHRTGEHGRVCTRARARESRAEWSRRERAPPWPCTARGVPGLACSATPPALLRHRSSFALTAGAALTEILAWLPVRSLLRCKSVCKAWRDIISDPIFIREHFRHSEFDYDFNQCFSYCDGLVFAPTGSWLYVFNPATKEVLRLPDSGRNNLLPGRRTTFCYCSGLGLDRRTGKYKVVQAFYRSRDHTSMGMDVFTIATLQAKMEPFGGRLRVILLTLLRDLLPA